MNYRKYNKNIITYKQIFFFFWFIIINENHKVIKNT